MKMIMAIVRPKKIYDVSEALTEAGYGASTRWGVVGRGKQNGIQVGEIIYDEMNKNLLMVVCEDKNKDDIVDIIMEAARSGEVGNSGDGKIFVVPVEESYTISNQCKDN